MTLKKKPVFNLLYSNIFYFNKISRSVLSSLDLEMLIKEWFSQGMKFDLLCFTFHFSELLHPCFTLTFLPLGTDLNSCPSPPHPQLESCCPAPSICWVAVYALKKGRGMFTCVFIFHTHTRLSSCYSVREYLSINLNKFSLQCKTLKINYSAT